MISIAHRIIKQVCGDKRSLGMIIVVPLLLLSLLYLLLGKSAYVPSVVVDQTPPLLSAALADTGRVSVVPMPEGAATAEEAVDDGLVDAVIRQTPDGLHILMREPDSVKTAAVTTALKEASAGLSPQGQTHIDFLFGSAEDSVFDSMGFMLLAVMSFFIIFLFSGISFVRERTSDTVERLMLTPVKTVSVVGGYVLGFGVFALLQSVLVIVYARYVLQMPFAGSLGCAVLVMVLTAVSAVVTGLLVSALSRNEFQVMQFIPVIIIPQLFFSGLIPVDTLPYRLYYLSRVMPLYYSSLGLKGVMLYGYGFTQIVYPLGVLTGMIALLFLLSVAVVKKYRAA